MGFRHRKKKKENFKLAFSYLSIDCCLRLVAKVSTGPVFSIPTPRRPFDAQKLAQAAICEFIFILRGL
jgi:hypothetical protein